MPSARPRSSGSRPNASSSSACRSRSSEGDEGSGAATSCCDRRLSRPSASIIAGLRALQDHPNPTIAALLLLLVVLAAATSARLRAAIAISVAAMLAFNFFLLPPFDTFTIADPQNWVALFVFLVVAVIASQLSAAARQRASEAEARRQEVTRLFDLSRDILLTTDSDDGDCGRGAVRRAPVRAEWHRDLSAGRTGWAGASGGRASDRTVA